MGGRASSPQYLRVAHTDAHTDGHTDARPRSQHRPTRVLARRLGFASAGPSCPGIGRCSGVAVAVMPDASGNGYWLVTATGRVYAFGDAVDYEQPGPQGVPVSRRSIE